SITTPSLSEDVHAAELAKQLVPGVFVVAKGAHFLYLDKDAMEHYLALSAVVRGEYEYSIAEICEGKMPLAEILGLTYRDADGQIIRNESRPFITDLDALPFPARHLAKNALYTRPDTGEMQTTIVTNRGCPFSCIFCLSNEVSGKVNRMRSPENVVAEIEECVVKHGIRSFLFRSDLFTQNHDWVKKLCALIIEKNLNIEWAANSRVDTLSPDILEAMKKAGCWVLAFGIETADPEMLKHINKRATVEQARVALKMTRAAGIRTSIYLLIGLPWDTPKTIDTSVRFAIETMPDYVEIFYPYPFLGTALHRIAVENKLLDPNTIPRSAYAHPAMPAISMTIEELADYRRKSLRRIYLRPRYIMHILLSCRSFKELARYISVGMATLRQLMRKNSEQG
ncbi:MAG: radical SAM protein, partial [Candidatus Sumerlaeales bacterium]|nr:radical SAM protein [Candidatus Sumerlaeales bacterium]